MNTTIDRINIFIEMRHIPTNNDDTFAAKIDGIDVADLFRPSIDRFEWLCPMQSP